MEPNSAAAAILEPAEIVANIDQKAMRLTGLLRDIDNHPVPLGTELSERLDEILEMLECRISATRTILRKDEAAIPSLSGSAA